MTAGMISRGALVVVAVLLAAGCRTPPPRKPARIEHYHLTMLATDAAVVAGSVLAISAADQTSDGATAVVSALAGVAYLSSGVAVHLVNDNPTQARRSLGRRVGIPLLGAAIGGAAGALADQLDPSSSCSDPKGDSVCIPGWALVGVLGGFAGAGVAIIYDSVAASVARPPPRRVIPVIVADRERTFVGLGGRF